MSDSPDAVDEDPGSQPEQDTLEDAVELDRLAKLPILDFERERKAAAAQLGMRTSVLDRIIESMRPKPDAATGRGLTLASVEPWHQPVATGELLDALARTIAKHAILSSSSRDAIALWIAHTWVYDRFQHTPRLSLGSPVKRCGKSTVLDLLRATCCRPLKADNISASGVFRTVEALRPDGGLTLLVDEVDSFLGDDNELRGILNSGFEKSGEVIRVIEVNGEHQPTRFATFCPAALAGIGKLPDTLADRSIPIILRRKAASETVTKLRAPGARDMLHKATRCLARWSLDRGDLLSLDPMIPDAMGDREGDISVPLLSIADDAGGEWPGRGRAALLDLFKVRNGEEGNAEAGTLLLADIRAIFTESGAARLPSETLVEKLGAMEARPWPEWKAGKPITAPQLARVLRPFDVKPVQYRPGGGEPLRGYQQDHFEDAWARYLPPQDSTSES